MILLQLIFGIIALIAVCLRWKGDLSKSLMIAIIVTTFLIPALLGLSSWAIIEFVMNHYYRRRPSLAGTIIENISVVQGLLHVLSGMLLLAYVFVRQIGSSESEQDSAPTMARIVDPVTGVVSYANYPAVGPSWKTNLHGQQLVSILRRREWAFLLDILPGVLFTGMSLWLIAMLIEDTNRSPIASLLSTAIFMVNLVNAIYIPLKDSLGGVSVGKMIIGCRVVDFSSGQPIGPGQSVVRNILFLIPIMPLVELIVASVRPDRRRLGDLMAYTIVVSGVPDFVDGVAAVVSEEDKVSLAKDQTPHPLDDWPRRWPARGWSGDWHREPY